MCECQPETSASQSMVCIEKKSEDALSPSATWVQQIFQFASNDDGRGKEGCVPRSSAMVGRSLNSRKPRRILPVGGQARLISVSLRKSCRPPRPRSSQRKQSVTQAEEPPFPRSEDVTPWSSRTWGVRDVQERKVRQDGRHRPVYCAETRFWKRDLALCRGKNEGGGGAFHAQEGSFSFPSKLRHLTVGTNALQRLRPSGFFLCPKQKNSCGTGLILKSFGRRR